MFPVTITLHNEKQLSAVMTALAANLAPEAPAKKPSTTAPAPAASAASSPTAAEKPASAPTSGATEGKSAAGNSEPAAPAASDASSTAPEVSFDTLKKAFLALSTKPGGRGLCEGVLKPLGLAKLSEAKPEQYAGLLAEINKAAV